MKYLFLFALALSAQPRQLAITIDDLPRGGDVSTADYESIRAMTAKLLAPLKGTHAIGFANPGSAKSQALGEQATQRTLKMWLDAGLDLGNHTNTHPDLNKTPLADYTADITAAEPALTKALGHRPVYFRHPFLHIGPDEATKLGLAAFLRKNAYKEAPVTVDNSDWMFAAVYAAALKTDPAKAKQIQQTYLQYMEQIFAFFEMRGKEVVGADFPQILLIHANQLNADSIPALLAMLRGRGYQFIPLEQALQHPAYGLADGYTGTGGFSWIHRWAKAKRMTGTGKGEPEEPRFITDLYRNRP